MKNMSLHSVIEWGDRYLLGLLVQALLYPQNCNSVTIALSTTALQSSIMTSGLELQFCFFKYLQHRENYPLLLATLLKWQRWSVPTQEGEVNGILKIASSLPLPLTFSSTRNALKAIRKKYTAQRRSEYPGFKVLSSDLLSLPQHHHKVINLSLPKPHIIFFICLFCHESFFSFWFTLSCTLSLFLVWRCVWKTGLSVLC